MSESLTRQFLDNYSIKLSKNSSSAKRIKRMIKEDLVKGKQVTVKVRGRDRKIVFDPKTKKIVIVK